MEYKGNRLTDSNLTTYAELTYGSSRITYQRFIKNFPKLMQNDYGEAPDCTLVSITAIIKFFKPELSVFAIYNEVESIARDYGYNGKHGTYSLTIRWIYNRALKSFDIKKKAASRYVKNVMFDFDFIKLCINENMPLLLNLSKDGRSFYANHTVTIMGYREYGDAKFLAVQDNWYQTVSYIDYQLLNSICSIQFLN